MFAACEAAGFEIDSLDGPVSAFVFDRERTREVQQQRGRVKLLYERGGAVDVATGAESPEDLEPPYYAEIVEGRPPRDSWSAEQLEQWRTRTRKQFEAADIEYL